jgi:hypothetical protein
MIDEKVWQEILDDVRRRHPPVKHGFSFGEWVPGVVGLLLLIMGLLLLGVSIVRLWTGSG